MKLKDIRLNHVHAMHFIRYDRPEEILTFAASFQGRRIHFHLTRHRLDDYIEAAGKNLLYIPNYIPYCVPCYIKDCPDIALMGDGTQALNGFIK